MSNPTIRPDGTKIYYEDGKRHRIGGAAIIWPDCSQEYYENDKRHRIGGPAYIEYRYGYKQYWIEGKQVTELEHNLLCDLMKLKGLI
jgi:hypothetical protein